MDQKINGHTESYLKRQAKILKKNQGIPHKDALDKSAINAGFRNWNHFVNRKNAAFNQQQIRKIVSTNTSVSSLKLEVDNKIYPYRKLLIAAINQLLERKKISLEKKGVKELFDQDGHLFTEILGYPSVVIWRDIGFEEIEISVWWKYDHSLHPQANLTGNSKESFRTSSPLAKRQHYKKFVGVTVTGWLERKEGKYLQGKKNRGLTQIYTRSGEKEILEKLQTPIPNGFQMEGKFHF